LISPPRPPKCGSSNVSQNAGWLRPHDPEGTVGSIDETEELLTAEELELDDRLDRDEDIELTELLDCIDELIELLDCIDELTELLDCIDELTKELLEEELLDLEVVDEELTELINELTADMELT
jgi:hypothetical protein